jgi:glycosyltransferase involved in cell wall biosynthesis
MLNVLALYADRSGCGQYRVMLPAEAVNARSKELDVCVITADHLGADATFDGTSYKIRRVDVPAGVKVVSFQRPLQTAMAGAIAWLRRTRPDLGIVVELDDDLLNVPTTNTAYSQIQPKYSPLENTKWLRDAISNCDVLTVSTAELARRYGGSRHQTFVVRNGVPAAMLDNPARTLTRKKEHEELNADRVIGWAGYVGTHPGDLQVTSNALADIVGVDRTNGRTVSFRNIGPGDGVAAALGLRPSDVEASGWLEPEMYRLALGELDVGIVPLADTSFNRAKSALKALEFAAAGVPVIASKLPEFEELQKSGMPIWLVKDRRREWHGALQRLLALDDDELADLGASHREFVRRNATVAHRVDEWARAWRAAERIGTSRAARRGV